MYDMQYIMLYTFIGDVVKVWTLCWAISYDQRKILPNFYESYKHWKIQQ